MNERIVFSWSTEAPVQLSAPNWRASVTHLEPPRNLTVNMLCKRGSVLAKARKCSESAPMDEAASVKAAALRQTREVRDPILNRGLGKWASAAWDWFLKQP
jgi:hypothetical protein